jgi:hypothetical protein
MNGRQLHPDDSQAGQIDMVRLINNCLASTADRKTWSDGQRD